MSNGVLVVSEHRRGELREITLEAVTAGRQLKEAGAGPLTVAVIASELDALVQAVSLEGVDEIVRVEVPYDEFNADVHSAVVEDLLRTRHPAVALTGFTPNGMSLGPTVAARMKLGFASDVIACSVSDGAVSARRQFYGGKVEAELDFSREAPVFLLLRPTAWEQATASASPTVTSATVDVGRDRVRMHHVEFIDPPAADLDITKATVLLAIGRGIGEQGNIPRLAALADKMGAQLAASRPLVDAGWVPRPRQVGQSGVTVRPKLYLALGISGAVQHIAGMKSSERIVAVNQDSQAPIFRVADYGAVADLFDVVDELERIW